MYADSTIYSIQYPHFRLNSSSQGYGLVYRRDKILALNIVLRYILFIFDNEDQ